VLVTAGLVMPREICEGTNPGQGPVSDVEEGREMDFNFTKEHEMFRAEVRKFVQRELPPLVPIMENNQFPHEIRKKMAEFGFYGILFPKEYGGQEGDYTMLVIAMEEIAKELPALAIHVQLSAVAGDEFRKYGTEKQKQEWLVPLIKGEHIVCFAFTEPDTGSDPGMLKTTAIPTNGKYVINGAKRFITHATMAKACLTFAKEPNGDISLFIVPLQNAGVSFGPIEDKLGLRGTILSDIYYDNVEIPEENLLGSHGGKFNELKDAMILGKMCLSAQCLGIMEACLEESVKYAENRFQRGRPISTFLSIRTHVAEMASKIEACRWLLYHNAWLSDNKMNNIREAAINKLFITQTAVEVVRSAVQIHGPYGICKQYKVERLFRDGKMYELLEGTSEVQRELIARRVIGRPSNLLG
jgi:butyryl-CoA dehydrogenase